VSSCHQSSERVSSYPLLKQGHVLKFFASPGTCTCTRSSSYPPANTSRSRFSHGGSTHWMCQVMNPQDLDICVLDSRQCVLSSASHNRSSVEKTRSYYLSNMIIKPFRSETIDQNRPLDGTNQRLTPIPIKSKQTFQTVTTSFINVASGFSTSLIELNKRHHDCGPTLD
jgi:hypothetical protein